MPHGRGALTLSSMRVINHASLPAHVCAGSTCRVIADPELGVATLRVVQWVIPGGACANLRSHSGGFVVIVSAGVGKQRLAGAPQPFMAPCTLVVPEHLDHEVINTGSEPIELLAVESLVPLHVADPRPPP